MREERVAQHDDTCVVVLRPCRNVKECVPVLCAKLTVREDLARAAVPAVGEVGAEYALKEAAPPLLCGPHDEWRAVFEELMDVELAVADRLLDELNVEGGHGSVQARPEAVSEVLDDVKQNQVDRPSPFGQNVVHVKLHPILKDD
uniref:Uncharacterized protein n=2 Tax=Tetraselmis sp. GSL018 TaxID=582737 RepID=A0A061RM43_9CHLO